MTPAASKHEGRIPFRLRIGVTGHQSRAFAHDDALLLAVRKAIRDVLERLEPAARATTIRLAAVSQLAVGADRVVVDQIEAEAAAREPGEHARLEVILPMPRRAYPDAQKFHDDERADFNRRLRGAAVSVVPEGRHLTTADSPAYAAASQKLVARSDVLIALWNGRPSRGQGGTAHTLLAAAALGKPCIWISSDGEPVMDHNLDPRTVPSFHDAASFYERVHERAAVTSEPSPPREFPADTLEQVRGALKALDKFNQPELREPAETDDRLGSGSEASEWVAAPFRRSSTLAARYRKRFFLSARLITALATLAAVMLALSLSFEEDAAVWASAETLCLLLVGVGIGVLHHYGWHGAWLRYRVLAERLRLAYFVAPTRADPGGSAGFEGVFAEQRSEEWVLRSLDEVWDTRPPAHKDGPVPQAEVPGLRERLANDWIGEQIRFHTEKAQHHAWWDKVLTRLSVGLFGLAIPVAVLHAFEVEHDLIVFLSITLPAAAASLGALLSVHQHRALKERYGRMKADLLPVQRALLEADEEGLAKAAGEAARKVAQENGDWFGAMWFLDIEHPP
jgi:hypothetical protein